MAKKIFGAFALAAGLLAVFGLAYRFYLQSTPSTPPAEVPYRTIPEFAQKRAIPGPGSPSSQEPPAPATTGPLGPKPPAGAEGPVALQEPEKQFGLLVGRYQTYREAAKVMEKLEKQGKAAFVRHEGGQRRPYEVWAGPFADEKEARAAARFIKKNLKLSARTQKLQLPVPK